LACGAATVFGSFYRVGTPLAGCGAWDGGGPGMAPDLKVDYNLLDQSEKALSSLVSEFQNIKAQESAYDGAMGSGDVASAMGDFAGNWDIHRKKLVDKMQHTGELIHQSKQAFSDTDGKLACSLTTNTTTKAK
jgi:uncharacterized protein YukE